MSTKINKKVVNIQDYFKVEKTPEYYVEQFLVENKSFAIEGSIKDKLNILTMLSKKLSFEIAKNSLKLLEEYTYGSVLSANIIYIKVSMMNSSEFLHIILDEVIDQLGKEYRSIINMQNELFEDTGISDMCYNLLSIIAESSEDLDSPLDPELITDFIVTTLEEFYKSCEFKTLSRDQLESFFESYPKSFLDDVSKYLSDHETVDAAIETSIKEDEIYDNYKLRDIAYMVDSYNQIVDSSDVKLLAYFRGKKDENYKKITKNDHYLKLKNYKVVLLYQDVETKRIIMTKRISNEEDVESIQIIIDTTSKKDIPFSISSFLDNEEGGDY